MRTKPKPVHQIDFTDKCFCFTGDMAELARREAEREVQIRGGLIATRMTNEVDYLVVGSIASPAWKFGNYGNKIKSALDLRERKGRPVIMDEKDFVDCLSLQFPVKNEHTPEKLLKIKYEFWDAEEDPQALGDAFTALANHVGLSFRWNESQPNEYFLFNYRANWPEYSIAYEFELFAFYRHADDLQAMVLEIKAFL